MSCPLSVTLEANRPDGAEVHFDAPSVTGGRPPYSVECTPGSGSVFPLEARTVACTATDAAMVRASCDFTVSVRVSRSLSLTKFVAFGDSITEGATSLVPLVMLGPPDTYPFKLEQMLRQRYPVQDISVIRSGVGGETPAGGAARLPSVLAAERPDVLLLLEGVNNIVHVPTNEPERNLREMIREAQRRGVKVIIATVMPATREPKGLYRERIVALNERIFEMADDFNLGNVVDLFAIFEANPHFLGSDGLHPTLEGQTRIAEAFRDEIIRRYEGGATVSSRSSARQP